MSMLQGLLNYLQKSRDLFTDAFAIMDNDHKYTHQGKLYETFDLQTIASSGTYSYELTTPASSTAYVHYRWGQIASSADKVKIELNEGATLTGGASMTSYNHNRNSSNTAEVVVKKGVTVSDAGTQIDQIYMGGGTGNGANASGTESAGGTHEWVLKPETTYLIRVTNGSSSSNNVEVNLTWYEELMGV